MLIERKTAVFTCIIIGSILIIIDSKFVLIYDVLFTSG